jgi:hypothetical protein
MWAKGAASYELCAASGELWVDSKKLGEVIFAQLST